MSPALTMQPCPFEQHFSLLHDTTNNAVKCEYSVVLLARILAALGELEPGGEVPVEVDAVALVLPAAAAVHSPILAPHSIKMSNLGTFTFTYAT